MKRGKSPAYQWYPKDFNNDENVMLMSLEEEGAYRRLIDSCWMEGSIPDDVRKLAAICKNVPVRRMERIWTTVGLCFHPHPDERGRLIHKKLERVRAERDAWVEKSRLGGLKSASTRRAQGKGGSRVVDKCLQPNANTASASPLDPSEEGSVQKGQRSGDGRLTKPDLSLIVGGLNAS